MDKVKTLQEVSKEIGEEIGKFKSLTRENGFFVSSFRKRLFELVDTKIKIAMAFPGKKQETSLGYFKSKKGYTSKFKNTSVFANHYGEYMAYIILKQLGKDVCKVDLGNTVVRHPYSGKEIPVEGILSHFQLNRSETVLHSNMVIEEFIGSNPKRYKEITKKSRASINEEREYSNIELILASFEDKLRKAGQEAKIPEIRKAIFDMTAFDLKFANRDRHDENFGLKLDQATDDLSFYHLFDNEQILGLQENKGAAGSLSKNDTEYEIFKKNELTSYIGYTGNPYKVKPMDLLEYLLEHYPDEILDSLEDIGRYKVENLEELMNACEGLSKEHKALAKKVFLDREKDIQQTITKYKEKIKSKDDDISL